MIFSTQDPKYSIEVVQDTQGVIVDAFLINAITKKPVDKDIPIFMFLAKDRHALPVLQEYAANLRIEEHIEAVTLRVTHFENFTEQYPERMKEPDTNIDTAET